jgi:hypothetical protein
MKTNQRTATTKRIARVSNRLGMVAGAALLALTASALTAGYAMAEQGANSPTTATQVQQQKKQAQPQQPQQNKQLLELQNKQMQQQQQQNAMKAQQQQRQAEAQQQQKLQQQKQAAQQQKIQQQQQAQQQNQARQLKEQAQQQNLLKQQQQQQQINKQQQSQQQQFNKQQQVQQQQKIINQQQQTIARQQAQIQRFDWNTYRPGQRPPLWAQYRQNFDPTPYQWARNAPRQYQIVNYAPPPGWRYQRWNYGQVYPRPYWQQQTYWLNNYQQYGLEPLPYGYVWVQNGPDALAVDSFSGVILQVIYGLFSGGGGGGLLGGLL